LYTRDTPQWLLAPWEGRAVLPLVVRKVDRAGLIDLGDDGMEALAALTMLPLEVVEVGMAYWLKKRTFELVDGRLVMPNFLEAQEAAASDRKRATEHRERARDKARATTSVTFRDGSSRAREGVAAEGDPDAESAASANGASEPTVTNRDATITNRDAPSRTVTIRHDRSHGVTPSRAVPSLLSSPPLATLAESPARRGRASRDKGTRLPEDWTPSEATILRFRDEEHVDALGSLEQFSNHWTSKTGNATKINWDKTFTNWVLKDIADGVAKPAREPEARPAEPDPEALGPEAARVELEKLHATLATAGRMPWEALS
jgi:hypothetical protein